MSAGWRCVPEGLLLSAGAMTHSGSPLCPPWTSDQAQPMESTVGSKMQFLWEPEFSTPELAIWSSVLAGGAGFSDIATLLWG